MNPFLNLKYETVMEDLGEDYSDRVSAASFPEHTLRYRGDRLLPLMNLNPETVGDDDFIEAFGLFQGVRPFLALRYHGYQFGQYNPFLGDGRGFLYGQVRGTDGHLYDFGTKGSGNTPYSRSADGRLTLKGGVREILAAETLHQLGVKTSRCLSLIETGEALWRGDEPSPTRASVMVRFSLSHIRFGTFERLHYIKRPDLIRKLLDRVIEIYYSHIPQNEEKYSCFYTELVQRVAILAAQWMAAGFCHGVLNTDNMSIVGESFDYGPYAFIPTYNPRFTAAYFDYNGLYCYANQPGICKWNLEKLQVPLAMVMEKADLDAGLEQFEDYYYDEYYRLMASKLGFESLPRQQAQELVWHTVKVLEETQIGYHEFFSELGELFSHYWRKDVDEVLKNTSFVLEPWETWRKLYYQRLNDFPVDEMEKIKSHLQYQNPKTALLRPIIESVWEPITQEDNWQPFYNLLETILSRK
ncbi:MAG: YdiU family protein [Cyanobacteria bacterium SBLK]|nr:YdiU family protein [Cyanobacteria bacterium SBLK]